jgi:hypothetical protein
LVDVEILLQFQIAQTVATMNNLDRLAHEVYVDRQEMKKRDSFTVEKEHAELISIVTD